MTRLKNFMKSLKLTCVLVVIFYIPTISARFSCQTPDTSDSTERTSEEFTDFFHNGGQHFNRDVGMSRWESNIVKYSLDRSLTAKDKRAVNDAIKEYHTKTCIKFELKNNRDRAYVHIEIDNSVCGYATGIRGRRQVAQMGGNCRDKHTMVHELGHIIGLDHEHQRKDRGDYIDYRRCDKKDPILRHSRPVGFYDYQSVMHYSCGSCLGGWPTEGSNIKCGEDFNNGLSVLDADHINSMHDCGGCKRHRWRPANQLTSADRSNLHSFGYRSTDGQPMYPCRSLYQGQVVLGQGPFGQSNARCHVIHSNRVIPLQNNVEVLTIPGGLRQHCYTYRLTSRARALVSEAVPVAAKNNNAQRKVYIAYGTGGMRAIGEISAINSFVDSAQIISGNNIVKSNDYSVLTCSCSNGDDTEAPSPTITYAPAVFPPPSTTTFTYPAVISRRVDYGSTPNVVTTAAPYHYIPHSTTPYPRTIPRQVSLDSLPTRRAQPTTTFFPTPIPRQVSYGTLPTRRNAYVKPISRQVSYGQTSSDESSNFWLIGKNNHDNFLNEFQTGHFADEFLSGFNMNHDNSFVEPTELFNPWVNADLTHETDKNHEDSEGKLNLFGNEKDKINSETTQASYFSPLDIDTTNNWFGTENSIDESFLTIKRSQNYGDKNRNSFTDFSFIEEEKQNENLFDEDSIQNANNREEYKRAQDSLFSLSYQEHPENFETEQNNWW